MYAWLWRQLPGPWAARALVSAVLILATVALLFTVVFPWAEPRLPFTDVTVDEQSAGQG